MVHGEGGAIALMFNPCRAEIGLAVEAVCHETLLDLRDQRLDIRIVQAQDGQTEKGHLVDEIDESLA